MRQRLATTGIIAFVLSTILFYALNTSQTFIVSFASSLFAFLVSSSSIFAAWFTFEQLRIAKADANQRSKRPDLVFSPTAVEVPVVGGAMGISPWSRRGNQFNYLEFYLRQICVGLNLGLQRRNAVTFDFDSATALDFVTDAD